MPTDTNIANDSHAAEPIPVSEPLSLTQLHVAEYQALTTRFTYWLTLQYALWPILLLALTFLAQARGAISARVLLWAATIITQVVVLAYYQALCESYKNVHYIERYLRREVQKVVGQVPFWEYERYIKSHRTLDPLWWEAWPLGLCVGAWVFVGATQVGWSGHDVAPACASAIVVTLSALSASDATRIRKSFFPNG